MASPKTLELQRVRRKDGSEFVPGRPLRIARARAYDPDAGNRKLRRKRAVFARRDAREKSQAEVAAGEQQDSRPQEAGVAEQQDAGAVGLPALAEAEHAPSVKQT